MLVPRSRAAGVLWILPQQKRRKISVIPKRKHRILFVDDEPSIRLTLPSVLEENGYEVSTVASVAEALSAINSSRFDVLLSDLNISEEGDGFRVVTAMRNRQPRCVTVILTGYPAFESAIQGIRQQVDDYLVKPADVDAILQTIERKLKRKTRKELRKRAGTS